MELNNVYTSLHKTLEESIDYSLIDNVNIQARVSIRESLFDTGLESIYTSVNQNIDAEIDDTIWRKNG